ncbi:matrilysin family metalloendoprotease (plasmid) [Bacillus sp. ZJS3]|uniref:matrixin family metalloprotease n=1 Tax=Bacillus sp. ZJS3 TaxID=2928154 RepID=UPI001FB3CEE7|nr:matrixin family metalloprotease [Bacillus sp. ZJS3]UOB81996.1 matrilysin family metalloendoprotease [Bacillus sp. ZJS3]
MAPVNKEENKEDFKYVQEYLCRFGYLQENNYKKNILDKQTSKALLKYQRFYGLPETGTFTKQTRDQMNLSRCGVPDTERSSLTFKVICPWEKSEITYAFELGTDDINEKNEFEAVRNAFKTWEVVTPLTFKEVSVTMEPDVLIGWRSAYDNDQSMIGPTLAHADYPLGCSITTNSLPLPIHFDDSEYTWCIGVVSKAYDVETVALHEIGHILGLEHSNVEGAVMFPTNLPDFIKRALTPDDIVGVERLYRNH